MYHPYYNIRKHERRMKFYLTQRINKVDVKTTVVEYSLVMKRLFCGNSQIIALYSNKQAAPYEFYMV